MSFRDRQYNFTAYDISVLFPQHNAFTEQDWVKSTLI